MTFSVILVLQGLENKPVRKGSRNIRKKIYVVLEAFNLRFKKLSDFSLERGEEDVR
jgi:hypothetical protein